MSGTWHFYGNGLLNVLKGNIDFDTDTFYIMLTTSAYTPDQDAHDYRDDVTNEVTDSSYTAGGKALSGVAVTYDSASNQARVKWIDPTWSSSTITARTAVIYKHRGGAASADELVAYYTDSGDTTAAGGTFTVDLPDPTLYITAA